MAMATEKQIKFIRKLEKDVGLRASELTGMILGDSKYSMLKDPHVGSNVAEDVIKLLMDLPTLRRVEDDNIECNAVQYDQA